MESILNKIVVLSYNIDGDHIKTTPDFSELIDRINDVTNNEKIFLISIQEDTYLNGKFNSLINHETLIKTHEIIHKHGGVINNIIYPRTLTSIIIYNKSYYPINSITHDLGQIEFFNSFHTKGYILFKITINKINIHFINAHFFDEKTIDGFFNRINNNIWWKKL